LKDQKIPLRITVPLNTTEVRYFVDGIKVSTEKNLPFTFLWLPTMGAHKVSAEAVMSDKQVIKSGVVNFLVR
jgi:hypothetical protein